MHLVIGLGVAFVAGVVLGVVFGRRDLAEFEAILKGTETRIRLDVLKVREDVAKEVQALRSRVKRTVKR